MPGRRTTPPRGRLPLTGRGWVVLAVAALSYGFGVWAGYPLFRALGGVALGALLAAVALTARQPRVDVRRDVYPDRVERGRPALATLRVRNTRSRWQAAFVARDVACGATERVDVRRLAPGAEATYRYELPTSRRGRFEIGPLFLERSDPLGLARRQLATGASATLRVYPRRHLARTTPAGRPRHHHEGRTNDDSLRGSADLRDVREYVVGDEVRHLHWKATARTGQLMVRHYVDPDQPRLTLLVDDRAGQLPPELFEDAVEVAASIASGAATSGHRCRLLTPGGLDVEPAAGSVTVRVLLDALTELDQVRGTSAVLPRSAASGPSGGAFVAITGPELAARDLAPLAIRFRPVTVVSLDRSPDTPRDRTDQVRWIVAADAADAVRRWNLEA